MYGAMLKLKLSESQEKVKGRTKAIPNQLVVVIKTFNRSVELTRLLRDFEKNVDFLPRVKLFVFDDHSKETDTEAEQICKLHDWKWVRADFNYGKKRAWEWHNIIYSTIKPFSKNSVFFFFDDDMRLCENFFQRALDIWLSLPQNAGSLHLMVDDSRINKACWTNFEPQRVSKNLRKIQWVDGTFICDHVLLDAIKWQLLPIPLERWAKNHSLSTGVGQQISERVAKDLELFQVAYSLVVHTCSASHYNRRERNAHPLQTLSFIDGKKAMERLENCGKITPPAKFPGRKRGRRPKLSTSLPVLEKLEDPVAKPPVKVTKPEFKLVPAIKPTLTVNHLGWVEASLATIPSREDQLRQVIRCLLPQVNKLRIYFNNYTRIPFFIRRLKNVEFATSQQYGDLGDRGKVFWVEEAKGYQFLCDDDIEYPPDYVKRMVGKLRTYNHKAAIGTHGIILDEDLDHYYSTKRRVINFSMFLDKDSLVHILGTGCLAYVPTSLILKKADFLHNNMADIFVGLAAQRQHVPLITMAREKLWLRPIQTKSSIYSTAKSSDEIQTAMVKSIWPWQLNQVKK